MSEQKWIEFTNRVERLVADYNRIRKERDEFKNELEELKKQTVKLTRGSKDDILLKERIKVLEKERGIIQEKVKKLLKVLKDKNFDYSD